MSRKVRLVTPRQYAELNGVAYTTVLYWLNNGRVEGAVKHTTPFGYYWELPENAPRPKSRAGRPKKEAAKRSSKTAKQRTLFFAGRGTSNDVTGATDDATEKKKAAKKAKKRSAKGLN